MAITYDKKEKCGEATFRRELDGMEYIYTVDLYVGNCFLIMVKETENESLLHSFFVDEDHMRRCLDNGIFTGIDTLTAITINKAKCRNYKKIIAILAEYLENIDIAVYKESMKDSVKAYEKAIDNNEHFIGIQCKLDPSEFSISARNISAADCQSITALTEWYYNQFYTLAGIKTNAEVDKKANLLYDEVHQYDDAANMHENLLDALEEDIDKVNKRFGLNIEIEKTSERQTGEAEPMNGSNIKYSLYAKEGKTL